MKLKISDNRRFLVWDDGSPFFWLGDTGWELFHRLTLDEARIYFENRARKGFTVIHAVVLAEFDGLTVPNVQGDLPLFNADPLQPNERYFSYIDQVIQLAAEYGLIIALLPTWGDKIELLAHGKGPIVFNPENARRYGEWIGRRYRNTENIIWVNGGDRSGGGANYPIWDALAHGIKSADPNHLMTYHPLGGQGGHSSSEWLHRCDWLDFNMAQSGHEQKKLPNYKIIARDYGLTPTKPCLDGEPRYEDHPVNWKPNELGWFDDSDARHAAYWALFSGAFGHSYGCQPVWQFYEPGKREPIGFARRHWREALDLPGSAQMAHLKKLMLSRPFLTRVPDDTLILESTIKSHIAATRDQAGRYAMIYLPEGGTFKIRTSFLSTASLIASWFNPRRGETNIAGTFANSGELQFETPDVDHALDWVLIIDAVGT